MNSHRAAYIKLAKRNDENQPLKIAKELNPFNYFYFFCRFIFSCSVQSALIKSSVFAGICFKGLLLQVHVVFNLFTVR